MAPRVRRVESTNFQLRLVVRITFLFSLSWAFSSGFLIDRRLNPVLPPRGDAFNRGARDPDARSWTRQHLQQKRAISSALSMTSWEDFAFNAQSAASSLASVSLDDPTNLISSIPVMYGAGLLTSVSPCVWGLLPLTMSYISTAAGERKDKDTVLPTLAFASGLALVFCSLGLLAATVGGALYGNSGNTSIFLPLLSNTICLLMGCQLLELIRLPLPSLNNLSTKLNPKSATEEPILLDGSGQILSNKKDSSQDGSLFRTFLLGGSSALVASPCATPVLTSILAFVANSSDPALGALLLFFYTLGYSTPLLIIAATGGQALVKLKSMGNEKGSIYAQIAPWITPFTAGILLWYGTGGLLTALIGDPSLAGMGPILY